MINIFEVFLPQLLRYPNPTDPLNGEAASMLIRDAKAYDTRVREYVMKYAANNSPTEENHNNAINGRMASDHREFQEDYDGMHPQQDHDISSISTFSDEELADAMDL